MDGLMERLILNKYKLTKIPTILCFICMGFINADMVLQSPDLRLKVEFEVINSSLFYKVYFDDFLAVENSPVALRVDGQNLGENIIINKIQHSKSSEKFSIRSVHSTAKTCYNTIQISFINKKTKMSGILEARAYDDGLAFRLIFENSQKREIMAKGGTFFNLPDDSVLWFHTRTSAYEGCYTRCRLGDIGSETYMAPPVTVELNNNSGYLAITEAALINFTGMCLMAERKDHKTVLREVFKSGGNFRLATDIITPWRIIMVARDLNTIVNSDIIYSCCPSPQKKLSEAQWTKPGRCVWSWLGGGGVTLENMKLYAKLAGKLGFEYNLVDEGWGHWREPSCDKWDLISELVDYSKKYDVKTWVWKACKDRKGIKGIYDRKQRLEFFSKCKEAGIAGVKIDFMNSESIEMVKFYNETLDDAAEYNLMINYHGSNKPTGLSRTYPNEMTREGIYGLEQPLWSWARHNTILPFTRFLAGHADYTPLSFTKRKGDTTWSHQLASLIVFTSPLMVYAEHPEKILNNPACDLIKKLPTTWDETAVLPFSEIGEIAGFARRKGSSWYIGILNSYNKKQIRLKLSFLDKGKYTLTHFKDMPDNHNAYDIEKKVVRNNDTINFEVKSGGGYAAILIPF
jgi:alpha-glucosidase